MNKEIKRILEGNYSVYIKTLLEKYDLNLEPYKLESGEIKKDYYQDKEKRIIVCLKKDSRTLHFTMSNSESIDKGTYEMGITETSDNEYGDVSFRYYGLTSKIRIRVSKKDILVDYDYEDGMKEPRIFYDDDEDKIIFKKSNGEKVEYSAVTSEQLVDMVEECYEEILKTSEWDGDAIFKVFDFEILRPILTEMISKTFVKVWDKRLANWKNEKNVDFIEEAIGRTIDNEDCEFVNCDVYKQRITYRTDEFDMSCYNIYGDYASMSIDFKDENGEKKSNVRVIKSREHAEPYIHFVFDFENGDMLNINFENENSFEFYTPSRKWTRCARTRSNFDMRWFEQVSNSTDEFRLADYGIENLIDRIYDSIKPDYDYPEFDRKFELIRPALFKAILQIGEKGLAIVHSILDEQYDKLMEVGDELKEGDLFAEGTEKNILKAFRVNKQLKEAREKIDAIEKELHAEKPRDYTRKK